MYGAVRRLAGRRKVMFSATWDTPLPSRPWQAAQKMSNRFRPRSSTARVTSIGMRGTYAPP